MFEAAAPTGEKSGFQPPDREQINAFFVGQVADQTHELQVGGRMQEGSAVLGRQDLQVPRLGYGVDDGPLGRRKELVGGNQFNRSSLG